MPQHEKKQCPRCNADFECKSGTILICQCSKIELSSEQLEYCHTQYDDCLCFSCLKEMQVEFNLISKGKNTKNSPLKRS